MAGNGGPWSDRHADTPPARHATAVGRHTDRHADGRSRKSAQKQYLVSRQSENQREERQHGAVKETGVNKARRLVKNIKKASAIERSSK